LELTETQEYKTLVLSWHRILYDLICDLINFCVRSCAIVREVYMISRNGKPDKGGGGGNKRTFTWISI